MILTFFIHFFCSYNIYVNLYTFSVTISYLIRPVATVSFRIVSKTLRTVDFMSYTVHAIYEFATVLSITNFKITILVRAFLRRLCRF